MAEKIEYPKMIYNKKGEHIVVKDREEHLVKQKEGFREHDGKTIGKGKTEKEKPVFSKEEETKEEETKKYEPVFTEPEEQGEKTKRGK